MDYLIHADKMAELNAIIGQQGSPRTSKVSDSFAALEVAIKSGNKADAQASFDAAVKANIAVAEAWTNAQEWHDARINEDQHGEDGGKDNPGPPAIPGNAVTCTAAPGANGGMAITPTISINGKNYGCHVKGGPGAPWYYTTADYDGDMASMSCDGKQIGFTVTDTPQDPVATPHLNTAYHDGKYRKGQAINIRIGEGGYYNDTTILVSVAKYAA